MNGTATTNFWRRSSVLLFFGLWTVFVIFVIWWLGRVEPFTSSSPVLIQGGDTSKLTLLERARDWLKLVHVNFQRIYPWVLFAPYVLWLGSRFHLGRGRLPLNLAIHVAGCAAFAVGAYLINSQASNKTERIVIVSSHWQTEKMPGEGGRTIQMRMTGLPAGHAYSGEERLVVHGSDTVVTSSVMHASGAVAGLLASNLLPKLEEVMHPAALRPALLGMRPLATLLDLLAYGSLAGLAHAIHFYGRYREREKRALVLESNLSRARLSTLQAQLQPHFLFNTLNAIATLLRRDVKAAEATLMSLSELLRLSLSRSEQQEIPLREEMHFLDRYLEIQQTRFGDRLRFEQQIEPEVLDCLVPTLLLQPLVENAIRHGLEPSPNPGTIRVKAHRREAMLELSVEDDGVGLNRAAKDTPAGGIGLSNLRARLEALYGSQQQLRVSEREGGGVIVQLVLPCKLEPAATPFSANEPS